MEVDNIGPYENSQTGLPLGCLTSQLFANIYLTELDHFVKDALSTKFYVRYMDDFIIIGPSKEYIHNLLNQIIDFLAANLHLKLNHKTQIVCLSHGVDFAGYRHFLGYCLPRKRNIRNAKIRFRQSVAMYRKWKTDLENVRSRIASFIGYMSHCRSARTLRSVLDKVELTRDWSLKDGTRTNRGI